MNLQVLVFPDQRSLLGHRNHTMVLVMVMVLFVVLEGCRSGVTGSRVQSLQDLEVWG